MSVNVFREGESFFLIIQINKMSYNGIGLSSVRGTATSGYVQANRSHVRNNRVRQQRERNVSQRTKAYNPVSVAARERGNTEIQKHEKLRRLENHLLEYRLDLEENRSDLRQEDIDERVKEEREKQMKRLEEEEKKHENQSINGNDNSQPREGPRNFNANRGRGYQQNSNNYNGRGYRNYDGARGDRDRHLNSQQRRNNNNRGRHTMRTTNSHVDATLKEEENERARQAFGINKDKHVEGAAFDRELQQEKKRLLLERKEKEQKEAEKAKRKLEREQKRREKALRKEGKDKKTNKSSRGRSKTPRSRESRSQIGRAHV